MGLENPDLLVREKVSGLALIGYLADIGTRCAIR